MSECCRGSGRVQCARVRAGASASVGACVSQLYVSTFVRARGTPRISSVLDRVNVYKGREKERGAYPPVPAHGIEANERVEPSAHPIPTPASEKQPSLPPPFEPTNDEARESAEPPRLFLLSFSRPCSRSVSAARSQSLCVFTTAPIIILLLPGPPPPLLHRRSYPFCSFPLPTPAPRPAHPWPPPPTSPPDDRTHPRGEAKISVSSVA